MELDAAKIGKQLQKCAKLVLALQQLSTQPTNPDTVSAAVEEKMAVMRTEIMAEIGVKMDDSN